MASDENGMVLGCHLSIGKGFPVTVDEAERLSCTALQIFSHNASSWRMKPIVPEAAARFRERVQESNLRFIVVHTMYLLNLASPDDPLHRQSIAALKEEVVRAAALGISALVTHLGAHKGSGPDAGRARVIDALNQVVASDAFTEAADVRLLLENTAGAGTTIGGSFEALAEILGGVEANERLGVCLDTCHAFAAGYDLRDPASVDRTVEAFDDRIGLDRLEMIHLNDSKFPVGSRRDRHAHIGLGEIGNEGMKAVVNHAGLRNVPLVLETPKKIDEQTGADERNLGLVRAMREEGEAT